VLTQQLPLYIYRPEPPYKLPSNQTTICNHFASSAICDKRSVFSRIFCKERVGEAGQEEGDCLAWI